MTPGDTNEDRARGALRRSLAAWSTDALRELRRHVDMLLAERAPGIVERPSALPLRIQRVLVRLDTGLEDPSAPWRVSPTVRWEDVARLTYQNLITTKGCGQRTAQDILDNLTLRGLAFADGFKGDHSRAVARSLADAHEERDRVADAAAAGIEGVRAPGRAPRRRA